MAIKPYKTREEIPEAVRETAIQIHDGTFIVDEPAKTDEDVARLTESLEAARRDVKEAEKARKAAATALANKEREDAARAAGVPEAELKRIRDELEAEYRPIREENARLAADNEKLTVDDQVQKLALGNGVMETRIEDAMAHLLFPKKERVRRGDQGGLIWRDKGLQDTADNAETFFAKLRIEKPFLFKGTGSSGSGAEGSRGGEDAPAPTPASADRHRAAISGAF